MKIMAGDISSQIVNPGTNTKALAIIRQLCRARPDGYKFSQKYKLGYWDGYISLMDSFSSFPTGMIFMVVPALQEAGYTVEVIPIGQPIYYNPATADMLDGIMLRDYQLEAANKLLEAKRGVAKMATNSGKTEVIAAILKSIYQPSIVLVHRKELMYQTAERLEKRGLPRIGMIGDGVWEPNFMTVAMVQTLSNQINDWEDVKYNQVLVIDECQHASATQTLDVMNKIPGPARFGFSGTPLKNDVLADMKLMAATGDIVVDVSNQYLIDEGYSAKPTIDVKVIEYHGTYARDEGRWWKADYNTAYERFIVNCPERNQYIASYSASHANGGKVVLILVNRIDHGNILAGMIPGSVFVSGAESTEYRKNVIDMLRTKPGVYIASPIFDEGIDIPALDVVVVAAGGKSQVKLLQRIGRGLRKKSGDNMMLVLDFIDDVNKYLLSHSNDRIDTYVQEHFDTRIVE